MDREGYRNLCGLITQARLSNPRGHPVLEIGVLKERAAGLICLLGTTGFNRSNAWPKHSSNAGSLQRQRLAQSS